MVFFIADNEITQTSGLQFLLKKAYPDAVLLPSPPKAFERWQAVVQELESTTTDHEDLIVVLDLGLESLHMSSVLAGVEEAFGLRTLRTKAVFLAFTQYGERAEKLPHYLATFDGLIDKQVLHGYDAVADQEFYIRQIIASALRKRAGVKPSYTLEDSLGVRLAVAAFGEEALEFLVQEVAQGWLDVSVTALTSGHSGAFLLAISGMFNGGPQRIIVKCARSAETIRSETRRVTESMAELGPLGEALGHIEQALHSLPHNLLHYYRQAPIDGESLLRTLARASWNQVAKSQLEAILTLERRCYEHRSWDSFVQIRPNDVLTLSAVDSGRADQSLTFLKDAATSAQKLGHWPTNTPSPADMVDQVRSFVAEWSTRLTREGPLMGVGQHGDLNPGNVLIPTPGKVVLIDFARLGRWPVGYDIARLATMLRIRLTDQTSHLDWVENRITTWASEPFCSTGGAVDPDRSVCPRAAYCDQIFLDSIKSRQPDQQQTLLRGYRLGALWDLIKVLSYADLSIFKRLWALVGCWQLSECLNKGKKPQ